MPDVHHVPGTQISSEEQTILESKPENAVQDLRCALHALVVHTALRLPWHDLVAEFEQGLELLTSIKGSHVSQDWLKGSRRLFGGGSLSFFPSL